jgi:hypothetical protein
MLPQNRNRSPPPSQVHRLAQARAAGMDMASAVPAARGAHGPGDGSELLTVRTGSGTNTGRTSKPTRMRGPVICMVRPLQVRDVATLLDNRWGASMEAAGQAAALRGETAGAGGGEQAGEGAGAGPSGAVTG